MAFVGLLAGIALVSGIVNCLMDSPKLFCLLVAGTALTFSPIIYSILTK